MTLLLGIAAGAMALLVVLITCVQILYLESMRIRSREAQSLQFFKETIEPKIGLETEAGALTFSLVKHIGLTVFGCLTLGIMLRQSENFGEALGGAVLISALFTIVGTHVIPQLVYHKRQASGLLPLVPLLRALAWIARPLSWTVEFLRSLMQLDGNENGEASENAEEPIDALINAGEEEGIIAAGDRELIQSVVAFGDKTVREVLTPRPDIVAIQQDKTLEELRELVITEQFSRIPAYDTDIDSITGFVHVRDMFELDKEERQRRTVKSILRPIRTVPETKPVNDLLREMQEEGAHLAVVVDEYGQTAGIVTMEDMVEEIVGEIHDEHEPERDFKPDPSGGYVVSGNFDLDRLGDMLDFYKPEGTESTTVGGLITEWLGHVPVAGEELQRDGIAIKVLASNHLRVDQVRIARSAPQQKVSGTDEA